MNHGVRAIVTVVPVNFPDRVEVQLLHVNSADGLTRTGEIYTGEPWSAWRTRFDLSEPALDHAEFTLACSESAQLGLIALRLPKDLLGREFVLEPN